MDSKPPEIFHIFLNLDNLLCWNNITKTGEIFSAGFMSASFSAEFLKDYLSGEADYFPFIPNPKLKANIVSQFNLSATSMYSVEYNAERVRRLYFPKAPSRLSSVYGFADAAECRRANQLYGWDLSTVRQFRLVPHPLNRVARVNMEVVSLMRSLQTNGTWSEKETEAVWRSYWSGLGSIEIETTVIENNAPCRKRFRSETIWEHLIEGKLELINP